MLWVAQILSWLSVAAAIVMGVLCVLYGAWLYALVVAPLSAAYSLAMAVVFGFVRAHYDRGIR